MLNFKKASWCGVFATVCVVTGTSIVMSGCGQAPPTEEATSISTGITPQEFTDAVHAVMMADRTVYAKQVVTRLKKQEAPVGPSEYWEDEDHTIPLPAQMFRMGAELVSENDKAGFTYALKSKWPLNPQNKAKTEKEIEALDYVAEHPEDSWYGEETIGDTTYFMGVYPDRAVAEACWSCHNDHANRGDDYPEFKKGDTMGAVIVRLPLK
ncbi:Tll0287-like domain-containing protein [Calycomorphotria hydatis]|uniref:Tll0287-like domain-containing protein n=1 Tax=Calycomorphotria hydatis TaxID=2528027 RepID=A0A517T9Z1_9PLAN|nr:DUF3365 domain-containing protein [Calycomorphotria hydatis]QDT65187.1 hypothetical protein V22_24340 [Calycomorphotria hydatis]